MLLKLFNDVPNKLSSLRVDHYLNKSWLIFTSFKGLLQSIAPVRHLCAHLGEKPLQIFPVQHELLSLNVWCDCVFMQHAYLLSGLDREIFKRLQRLINEFNLALHTLKLGTNCLNITLFCCHLSYLRQAIFKSGLCLKDQMQLFKLVF